MQARFCTLGVAVGLLLAGCADMPALSSNDPSCRIRQDTAVTLGRTRGFFLLPATLEGRNVQMVLDTGAEVSTLSPAVAGDFGLEQDPLRGRVLRGVGGDVRTGSALASRFAVSGLPPMPVRFSLGTGNLLPGMTPPVAGLLGADLLGGRDIDLDAPRLRAGLFTIAACPRFLPWPGAAGVALTRAPSGLGFVIVELDGRAVRALVDTGARTSFMTRRLALSLGITEATLAADPVSTKVGISRSEIDVRQHRFDSIALGPVTWRDVMVGVADVQVPGVDMLLGADLLARQRIWISPARGMLWLQPAAAPALG